jgi:hypothetical protein
MLELLPDRSLIVKLDDKRTTFKLKPDIVAQAVIAKTLYPKLRDQLIKIIETRLDDADPRLDIMEQRLALRMILSHLKL